MSGTKKSREHLKSRFLKYMFPTEEDFANVFESYVHKDDTIDPDQVKVDDKTITEIIDGKSDEGHKHEIADVNGLESALNAISQILGKQESETLVQLAQRFASLTGKYTNVYTFVTKVKEFLEDADAADETINRWREIESFLQGITDTETLLGLLQEMKHEILQSIPQPQQGNYLELVADLDTYTDAPTGKIVQYTGPTTDNYRHGYIYEKVGGNSSNGNVSQVTIPPNYTKLHLIKALAPLEGADSLNSQDVYSTGNTILGKVVGGFYHFFEQREMQVGDTLYHYNPKTKSMETPTIVAIGDNGVVQLSNDISGVPELSGYDGTHSEYISTSGVRIYISNSLEVLGSVTGDFWIPSLSIMCGYTLLGERVNNGESFTINTSDGFSSGAPASWQPLKVQNVID